MILWLIEAVLIMSLILLNSNFEFLIDNMNNKL